LNPRLLLIVSGVLLFIVSEVVDQGGPLGSIAAPEAKAHRAAPTSALVDTAPTPKPDTSDFFANYEPPEVEEVAIQPKSQPVAEAAASAPAGMGALTLTQFRQLGLELPSATGLALRSDDFVS
jgi:hypothetical protein